MRVAAEPYAGGNAPYAGGNQPNAALAAGDEEDDKDGDADDEANDSYELIDYKFEESDKGKEKVTNAAKEEAEKTSEVKDDTKKTELPPSSSSLSVSSGFSDQFLKLSFDSSLVSTVKDSVDIDVSSLLDIPI
ncbi:hypothetical protein Tco_0861382 [Tanacetum coccineum]|uniref:Uncharacterized protein n=1 Tax=Tanacetum coccineum TaxID=301880 RepID=A0ABQ5BHN4_9ASTR